LCSTCWRPSPNSNGPSSPNGSKRASRMLQNGRRNSVPQSREYQRDRVVRFGCTKRSLFETPQSSGPATGRHRGSVAPAPEWFPFTDRRGRPLKPRHLMQILHRLSRKAGLPPSRRLHPHAPCVISLLRPGYAEGRDWTRCGDVQVADACQ